MIRFPRGGKCNSLSNPPASLAASVRPAHAPLSSEPSARLPSPAAEVPKKWRRVRRGHCWMNWRSTIDFTGLKLPSPVLLPFIHCRIEIEDRLAHGRQRGEFGRRQCLVRLRFAEREELPPLMPAAVARQTSPP